MIITDVQTNTDPALDPEDTDATLLDHAMQCTWTKTNDCDDLWVNTTGKVHCIRTQDVNGIQWWMLALQVVGRTAQATAPSNVYIVVHACNYGTLSSRLEEDGEHIYEHINNKLNERNSDTQWHNVTVLKLAIIAKHQDYMQI
jgi:hypothetical protein